jgi:hypothetical protein
MAPASRCVRGEGIEYSDHHEWVITAYRKEEQAKTHVALAEAWERENGASYSRMGWQTQQDAKSPYDPFPVVIAKAVPQAEVKG